MQVGTELLVSLLADSKYQKCKEQFKERKADGRYKPDKEEWAKTIREHRHYKQKLYLDGELKESED